MLQYTPRYNRRNVQDILERVYEVPVTLLDDDPQVFDSSMDVVLSTLPWRDRRALLLVYGLTDGIKRTRREAGNIFYNEPMGPTESTRRYRTKLSHDHPLVQHAIESLRLSPDIVTGNEVLLRIKYRSDQQSHGSITASSVSQHVDKAVRYLKHPNRRKELREIVSLRL